MHRNNAEQPWRMVLDESHADYQERRKALAETAASGRYVVRLDEKPHPPTTKPSALTPNSVPTSDSVPTPAPAPNSVPTPSPNTPMLEDDADVEMQGLQQDFEELQ